MEERSDAVLLASQTMAGKVDGSGYEGDRYKSKKVRTCGEKGHKGKHSYQKRRVSKGELAVG